MRKTHMMYIYYTHHQVYISYFRLCFVCVCVFCIYIYIYDEKPHVCYSGNFFFVWIGVVSVVCSRRTYNHNVFQMPFAVAFMTSFQSTPVTFSSF